MSQIQSFSRLSAILTMDNTQFLRGTEVASKKLAAFSAKATTFGANITRSLGVGFALAGTAAVKTAADFNRAQATLGAIVGKNTAAFGELNEQARELGRTTIFTATSVAQAQLEISKLGFNAERTKDVIKSSADIAAVFGSTITDVGKTIAATVNQFGLEAKDSGDVADIMAVAFRDSALDVSKFAQSMKNVGPTAKATGLDLKKTTALLAVLANNAVDGSLGGTKLRSTLSDLAKQFPDAAAGLKKLENGTLSYAELVELLNKRAALVGAIFQDQGDAIEEMEKKLDKAKGTTGELAGELEGELFYNVERLSAAMESLGISIGNAMGDMVADLANSLEGLAKAIDETDPAVIEAIASALATLAVTGIISLLVGQIAGLANGLLGFATLTIPQFAASVSSATGLMGAFYAAFLPGAVIAGATFAVGEFFKMIDEQGDRAIDQFIRQSEAAVKQMKKLSGELFDLLSASERLEGGALGETLGVDGLESGTEALEASRGVLTKLYKDQDDYAELIDDLAGTQDEAGRKERRRLLLKEKFNDNLIKQELERIKNLERFLDLLGRQEDLETEDEPVVDPNKGFRDAMALDAGKIKFDDDKFLSDLRKGIKAEAEFPHVFGQNFAFDELSLSDQVAALMNGELIRTAAEFDNLLDTFELGSEEFEDPFDEMFGDDAVMPLAEKFIEIREGLDDFESAALGVANMVGQAFLQAADGAKGFGEALKDGFLTAFKAIIAKLITLITLYAILAVLSGGASMKAGGSFSEGLNQFTDGNPFGSFLLEGLQGGRSASMGTGSGNERSLAVNVGGGLSGGDIAFAASSGRSANDRRFG